MNLIYTALPALVPMLAVPATLFFGWRKTLGAVLAIAVLLLVGPYIFFGGWALAQGYPFGETLKAVTVTTQPLLVITGYMIFWSCAYGGVAALVVWGWTGWRSA